MIVFNKPNYLDNAFKSLDQVSSLGSTIFYDSLPNLPYLKKPIIGSLVLKAKDISADTGSDIHPTTSLALGTMGAVTAFSLTLGIFTLDKAYNSYKSADAMHDENGKRLSKIELALRHSQIVGGGCCVFSNVVDLANRGFKSLRNLSSSSSKALLLATYCLDVLYLGLIAVSFLNIRESFRFLGRVKNSTESVEELKFLIGELTGNGPVESSKRISIQDIHTHLGLELRSMLNEIDSMLAAKLSDKKLGKALFKDQYKKFLPTVLNRMGIDPTDKDLKVESLIDNKELIQRVWAKEKSVIHTRVLGFKGMQHIRKAKEMHLYELLLDDSTKEYAQSAAKELLQELKVCSKKQRHISIAYLVAGSVGATFSVISKAFIFPLETAVSKVGFLVFFLLMGYGDVCDFLEVYKSGVRAGEYAKFCAGTHLALGVVAVSAFAVTLSILGGGIPIASLIIIGGVWISLDVWMLLLLNRREKEYVLEHPTLGEFLDLLNRGNTDYLSKEALEMFHKLPKLQRESILRSLVKSNPVVMKVCSRKLKTFAIQGSLLEESLESKGRRLYNEQNINQQVSKHSFELANKILTGKGCPLDKDSLNTHPCKHLFYKTFYNEQAKADQQKFCETVGKKHLKFAVEKIIGSSEEVLLLESEKLKKLARNSLP